jgi:hypothetical protein
VLVELIGGLVRHALACVLEDSGSLENALEGENSGGVDRRRSDDESHGLISPIT